MQIPGSSDNDRAIFERLELENERVIEFIRNCVSPVAPIAPFEFIRDSQSRKVAEKIFSKFKNPRILDYGCGNARFLNLLLSDYQQRDWSYCGFDPHHKVEKDFICERARFIANDEIRSFHNHFDVVVIMNVIHELSVFNIATAIEDARLSLSSNGLLFVSEMTLISKGEPRFIPFYIGDLKEIFINFIDESFVTKSGVPIMFLSVPKDDILNYYYVPDKIYFALQVKQYAIASIYSNWSKSDIDKACAVMGLASDKCFNYAYLSSIMLSATLRLIEAYHEADKYHSMAVTSNKQEIDNCGHDIVVKMAQHYENTGTLFTLNMLYEHFSQKYSYVTIKLIVDALSQIPHHLILFNSSRDDIVLYETFDILEYEIGFENILKNGFYDAVIESRVKKYHKTVPLDYSPIFFNPYHRTPSMDRLPKFQQSYPHFA